jgi:ribulose-5-phosphate 4-epimerase/fuculose-1-phosphate aldolase
MASAQDTHPYSEAEWQTRVELAAAHRLTELFGYTYLVYNHITARVPGVDDQFLINRFGWRYGEITASSLLKIDLAGNVLGGSPIAPHELNQPGYVIHSAVHGARHDVGCVMHTHTSGGTAVSALECGFIPLSQDGMVFYNRVAYHEFEGLASDVDERERLVTDLGDRNAMILRNHGLLTVGTTIGQTFVRMHNLERACALQIQVMSTGQPIHLPPPEVCEKTAQQLNGTEFPADEWPALIRWLDAQDTSYRN